MTVAPGTGNACYIESLLAGLDHHAPMNIPVSEASVAISGVLTADKIRFDGEMINAGSMKAAEVRDTIRQSTGVDIGVTVIQYVPHEGRLVAFQATQGEVMLCLLYTPGHFDFVAIDGRDLLPLFA